MASDIKPAFGDTSTLERCENGHPLSVVVHRTEYTEIWEQDEGATLLLFLNPELSTRTRRTITVCCENGCAVSRESEGIMVRQYGNSE